MDSAPDVFNELTLQLEKLNGQVEDLELLQTSMKQCGEAFDTEDYQKVASKIKLLDSQRITVSNELQKRQHLYSHTVQKMEEALNTRMNLLESLDSQTQVLETHPELMTHFSSKQATLTDILQKMKVQLSTPVSVTLPHQTINKR